MAQKRILIVEDDDRWRDKILRETLEKAGEGYDVATAATYDQALDWLKQGQFALVTMDISLTDSSLAKAGLDLADHIANFCRSTKVIVVSGSVMSMREMRDLFKECDIYEFFEKDVFSRRRFLEAVRRAVADSNDAPDLDVSTRGNIKILVIFANPRGSVPLRLEEEERIIRECIDRSTHRDRLDYAVIRAARTIDVQRALLEDSYRIVQFSGHATPTGNLALEDDDGELQPVPQQALAELLRKFSSIECVLLNACFSLSQGRLISLGVPFTIAMAGPISGNAAKCFTRGFYDAIGAGKDYADAYELGRIAMSLEGYTDDLTPRFLKA
jgi:CheY-like chemotaxis protein